MMFLLKLLLCIMLKNAASAKHIHFRQRLPSQLLTRDIAAQINVFLIL